MSSEKNEVLEDIQRWVKIIGIQQAKSVLDDALSGDDPEEDEMLRKIYYLTNGENSTREIASHVSVGKDTVSDRQRQWAAMGLLEREHSRAPYKTIISLQEAGFEEPEVNQS